MRNLARDIGLRRFATSAPIISAAKQLARIAVDLSAPMGKIVPLSGRKARGRVRIGCRTPRR